MKKNMFSICAKSRPNLGKKGTKSGIDFDVLLLFECDLGWGHKKNVVQINENLNAPFPS